jgi:hypothetical protein
MPECHKYKPRHPGPRGSGELGKDHHNPGGARPRPRSGRTEVRGLRRDARALPEKAARLCLEVARRLESRAN